MIKVDFSGFEELERELKKIEQNLKNIEGENSIPFMELFPFEFMKKYTQFSSINDMFNGSPFTINSEEDFAAIDEYELDNFINKATDFDSWGKMQETAAINWAQKQLGF